MDHQAEAQGTRGTRALPERVGQLYYTHGLFCSSHSTPVIVFAVAVILLCCYPLLNLPLPGTVPLQHFGSLPQWDDNPTKEGITEPRWLMGPPLYYIQQILLRTAVCPWTEDLVLTDAFRAPLAESFKLLEIIRNYQHENSSVSLSQLCFHVESPKLQGEKRMLLPQYNCLILSPASLWHQNPEHFEEDSNLLDTIFKYQNLHKSKMSLTEMLFGMRMKDTGIKRYPLRTRQRIIQFAVTLVLKEHDIQYMDGLRHKLATVYPLHQPQDNNNSSEILHIYYPGEFDVRELVPLCVSYIALFVYVYFSVHKIEVIKSKFGVAFSALVTVIASLFMTLGLCFFFGLTLTLNGRGAYPYLIIIIGLENVLVLTLSVVSTPAHLDVKIRLAKGLSREGWSITKNLLTAVTILTIGLFTFVPVIQEFCIFAIVGLLSDFFLQMLFFSTVLAIDIRRMDLSAETLHHNQHHRLMRSPVRQFTPAERGLVRSRSQPRLNSNGSYPANVVASYGSTPTTVKVPKRLKLVHFWARTRIFQRAFMVFMVAWISIIAYNSGTVEQLFQMSPAGYVEETKTDYVLDPEVLDSLSKVTPTPPPGLYATPVAASPDKLQMEEGSDDLIRLQPSIGFEPRLRLSPHHWSALLSLYNTSLAGRYISVLPTIKLSLAVPPEKARLLRNPSEKAIHFQWQTLAAALDPLDFSDGEVNKIVTQRPPLGSDTPFVPSSPMELFLTAVLCVVSVLVLAYMLVVLYRCICSRNYAEWRASWAGEARQLQEPDTLVMEALPLILEGHSQQVEWLATDGCIIVSSCLSGQIFIWDSGSGEQLATIDRRSYFSTISKRHSTVKENEEEELLLSDYESGSPPSRGDITAQDDVFTSPFHPLPDLRPIINCNFSSVKLIQQIPNKSGFDYGEQYRKLYRSYENLADSEISESSDQDSESQYVNQSNGEVCALEPLCINNKRQRKLSHRMKIGKKQDYNRTFQQVISNNSCDKTFVTQENETSNYKCVNGVRSSAFKLGNDNVSNFNTKMQNTSAPRTFSEVNSTGSVNISNNTCDIEVDRFGIRTDTSDLYQCESLIQPAIWCIDTHDNLLIIGCASGRVEFWEGSTGRFRCLFDDGSNIGVTGIKCVGNRIIAAKLNGSVDFLELESYVHGRTSDWGFSSFRRTHVRTGSAGSVLEWDSVRGSGEELHCVRLANVKAHQQPITVLDCEGGRVLTGSKDHTLKVFRLEDQLALYTLHGHCGPISCMFIDRISPMLSGSGSQDGLLCVWDLLTGACMYSIQAHDGCVTALTYSASYVISLGADERLCVWERFQGHLLNTIQLGNSYCSSLVMLTHNLLVTSKQGSLIVWDVRTGNPVRLVKLGQSDKFIFLHQILLLQGDSVVCDYGNQLRIVRFPLITDKID